MGNHVGIEREPATLVEVLECKEDNGEHQAKVKFNNKNNKHEFSSTLHLWRFFADPDNSENIKNAPVLLTNSFKGFDSLQCYLILHIFLEGQKFTTHASPTTPPPTSSENDATVANLLSSSTEALTPRGLSNCLEEALIVNSKASETGLSYNIYVWHGKDSLNPIRAVAMAKRFELANALKAKKLTQTLFLRGEKMPLTSVFRYDPFPSQKGSNGFGDEGINNHLFRQLLRRDSSELHQGKAPQQSGGSMVKATTFSRLNQVFPENGTITPPTSPTKDLQGRSRSEGSLKDLIEHATKETNNNNKHDTHIEQDDDDDDDDEDASERKKDKKKKKKSKKDSKKKAKRAAKLSKTTSISQPSLVTKVGLPALDLTKKPAMGKPGLSINIKGLDKVNQAEQQEAPQKKESIALDLRRGSMPPQSSFGDPSFTDSENKIKSEKLKYFDIICSKITDDLYLGSQTVSRDKTLLNETGVTHILNCAGSICPEYYPGEFVYRTLYLTDGVKEDILCLLYDVIEWIDEVVSNKGKVFIHCQQGVSRSSAIMIGYLMWKKDWNYEEAQLFVKARRGVSSPNTGFICQLLFLERRLHDPKRETRIYHITNHSRHDTGFLVGKNTRSFPISEISNSNSKSCYIVQVPECFYIWVGGKCEPGSFEVAKQTVRRVQAFEKATQNVHIINQGEEENEFKEFIAKLGQ